MSHASLCFLSYERPHDLLAAVRSAVSATALPVEVIVHDDGSRDKMCREIVLTLLDEGLVSHASFNPPGHNEGVGTAFNRCAKIATGDPIIKLDQDLRFHPGWLEKLMVMLNFDWTIGAAGLFKYFTPPVVWQEMEYEWGPDFGPYQDDVPYHYVKDFVGSAIAIPRAVWQKFGPWAEHSDAFAEDVEFKTLLKSNDLQLALPDEDLAKNVGFGPPRSTVVHYNREGGVDVSTIHHGSKLIEEVPA